MKFLVDEKSFGFNEIKFGTNKMKSLFIDKEFLLDSEKFGTVAEEFLLDDKKFGFNKMKFGNTSEASLVNEILSGNYVERFLLVKKFF